MWNLSFFSQKILQLWFSASVWLSQPWLSSSHGILAAMRYVDHHRPSNCSRLVIHLPGCLWWLRMASRWPGKVNGPFMNMAVRNFEDIGQHSIVCSEGWFYILHSPHNHYVDFGSSVCVWNSLLGIQFPGMWEPSLDQDHGRWREGTFLVYT